MNSGVYELIFNADRDKFVSGHRILGRYVFPTAGYLELVLANLRDGKPLSGFRLQKISLIHPLFFESQEDRNVHVEIRQKSTGSVFTIKSLQQDGAWLTHCEGWVERLSGSHCPGIVSLAEIQSRCIRSMHYEELYSLFHRAGVEHGPYYQSVDALHFNETEVVSDLLLPGTARAEKQKFILHPSLMDGAFQTSGFFPLLHDGGILYLPFYIEKMTVHGPLPARCYCYCEKRGDHAAGSPVLKYDMKLCNPDGEVKVEIIGFSLKSLSTKNSIRSTESASSTPQKQLSRGSNLHKGVAIIGMAGSFPGAPDLETIWNNLAGGVDGVKEIPSERWNIDQYYDEDPAAAGKTRCRFGSFLEDIDKFDPVFFGISCNKAALMDPQQRLMLQTAWTAVEEAGYGNGRLSGTNTAVYIGVSNNEYMHRGIRDLRSLSAHVASGNAFSAIANRISFFLNIHGESQAVDTACSSSLIAVFNACKIILNGDCEYAIAGGVNLTFSPETHIVFDKAGVLSPDGCCRSFDDDANGYVRGEGVGAVLLKSLDKAIKDGDIIHAIILGGAVNHGGRTTGFNTPSAIPQKSVILEACQQAGISLETVSYVEAHGTGTPLGDAVEFRGLVSAFGEHTSRKSYCAIGTLKSNIGHLESAAGIASLIKTILALKRRQIPPNLHFMKPNYRLNFKNSPFFLNDRLLNWKHDFTPNRAGISAFGFGGTNAHLILEEAPRVFDPPRIAKHEPVLTLSARNKKSLMQMVKNISQSLHKNAHIPLNDICGTLSTGRDHYGYRIAVTASSREEMIRKLDAYAGKNSHRDGIFVGLHKKVPPRLSFLFGDHYALQCREFHEGEPIFRETIHICDKIVADYLRIPLMELLSEDELFEDVARLVNFVKGYAVTRVLISYGIAPGTVAGCGVGEYLAAVIAEGTLLSEALPFLLKGTGANLTISSPRISMARFNGDQLTLETLPRDKEDLTGEIFPMEHAREWLNKTDNTWVIEPAQITSMSDLNKLVSVSYVKGIDIDWNNYHGGNKFRRVSLPTYPFKKTSYWLD